MERNPEIVQSPFLRELQKSQEVSTDDFVVIGPEDETKTLEVSPTACGIMTLSNKEHQVVGMIHFSLYQELNLTRELINGTTRALRKRGLGLGDCELRFFHGSSHLVDNLRVVFEEKGVAGPTIETMGHTSIRIDKQTGEVSFFSKFGQ